MGVPQTIMTIQPTFTVSDWAVAEPIMAEFVEATKKETGCIYYGWTRNDDKLFCREAYVDAEASLAHLDNVGPLVGKLLESAATLDQIELHGPAAELHEQGGGSVRSAQTLMTIQPTFTIKDWEAAKPIMEEFVERTKTETGCVYYGWTKVGDKLFCREAYNDAAGVLE